MTTGFCGYPGTHTFNLKVDEAIRDELDSQYIRPSGSKIKPKLWDYGQYWSEGYDMADYDCEMADRQSVTTARGLLSLYRRAADLPQPKPWLDASGVIRCEEMPNYFGCKSF